MKSSKTCVTIPPTEQMFCAATKNKKRYSDLINIQKDDILITPPNKKLKGDSINWCNHKSRWLLTTCKECKEIHGKIYKPEITPIEYEQHPNCKCTAPTMRTKHAGTATQKGTNGADFYLKYLKKLPDYYILKDEAKDDGWKKEFKFVSDSSPGMMIGGDDFYNTKRKLPESEGRTWKEADLDYTKGKRNSKRILWSNDGLIFVSYDHYQTFYEITEAKG